MALTSGGTHPTTLLLLWRRESARLSLESSPCVRSSLGFDYVHCGMHRSRLPSRARFLFALVTAMIPKNGLPFALAISLPCLAVFFIIIGSLVMVGSRLTLCQ